jgi:hypothetical protein
VPAGARIRRVLDLVNVSKSVPVEETVASAVAAARERPRQE